MKDVHNTIDDRNIKIDFIGVDSVKIPINFMSKQMYNSIASISSGISLNEKEKGAHLSRIVEVFNESLNIPLTIKELSNILIKLSNKIESENVLVNITFPVLLMSSSPISKKISYTEVLIELEGFKKYSEINKRLTVSLNGAMCCPSSKMISDYGAHSQRCSLKVSLKGLIDNIKIEDVAECMENSFSAPVSSVVKRADEKYLTEKAYENPKFSEDLIRDVLIALNRMYENVTIDAEAINFESIHSHNVRARGSIKR